MSFVQRLNPKLFEQALKSIGADMGGVKIMRQKPHHFLFKIFDLPLSAMHILKQEALSVGADLAVPRDAILCQNPHYTALLFGSESQMQRIIKKCLSQPFSLRRIAQTLQSHLQSPPSGAPKLMAILNLTPDSFYAGSRFDPQAALARIRALRELSVPIIDIGAASSRPNSELIEPQEELGRLRDLLLGIKQEKLYEGVALSIDTYNPEVAEFALDCGFTILNDILGFQNPRMLELCSQYPCDAILMHSRGVPKTMQSLTHYPNLFAELDAFFASKIVELKEAGARDIILDIGFGFAKEMRHNLALIQHLIHFQHFGLPLLVGASRKNTLGILTDRAIQDRLSATLAMHHAALENGARILRVHDVEEHIDLLRIREALEQDWEKESGERG